MLDPASSLLAATLALSLTPVGPLKDGMLAMTLCLSVATGAERGLTAAKSSAGLGAAALFLHASGSTGVSPAPPLGPFSLALAATLSLALVCGLVWWDYSTGPRLYVILAGGAAFFATFRPVLSQCVPATRRSSMSLILCSLVTLSLCMGLLFWPEYLCGMSVLYVCFVSQAVQAAPLDSVAIAVALNVASAAVEFVAAVGFLPFSAGVVVDGSNVNGGAVDGGAATMIWRNLKDLAVAGTLFPVLLAFDADSGTTRGGRYYFYIALGVLFCCLLAIGVFSVQLPLCFLSTPLIVCALLACAFARSELSVLLGYRISASVDVKKK